MGLEEIIKMALGRWLLRMWTGLNWLMLGLIAGFSISTVTLCILQGVPGLRSVMQYLISEVILSQICHVYVVLICSCPRIVGIYNKLNKAEKKEVNCVLRPYVFWGFCHGVNDVFTFLECSAALVGSYRHFETGCWYQNFGNCQSTLCNIKEEWRPCWV
jgi:hypothetical protein